jgi:DNA-binding MarR family transcriptional regulator
VRLLTITSEGNQMLRQITPAMLRAQERILEPLPASERKQFMRMLRTVVESNNALSRAPSEA